MIQPSSTTNEHSATEYTSNTETKSNSIYIDDATTATNTDQSDSNSISTDNVSTATKNVDATVSLESRARTLSQTVARDVFGITSLYAAQLDVLTRLALMKFKMSPHKCAPVLFVHRTGGGKSLVRDVHSVLFRGVSLTIVPVLSLGADLSMKVRQKASQTCGRVISLHLDEISNKVDAQKIIDNTLALPIDTRKTIMLFASPQALIDKSHWKKFIKTLVSKNMLRLIAVDEVHLFVQYGLSFRAQFAMLSTTIFKQIKVTKYTTKVPIIFMTASCTREIFDQLQSLSGLLFTDDRRNIFWPRSHEMMKNTTFTRIVYNNRPLSYFVNNYSNKLGADPSHRHVFYGNSRLLVENSADKYGEWLDKSPNQSSDYLKIVGTMKKEEKFHCMKLFCKDYNVDDGFNPQVLFATSGAANCGIDNPNIYSVFRGEVPPSCEDMIQEEGRAGRRLGANPSTDSYTIAISLESLLKLWRRIYVGTVDKMTYRKSLLYDVEVMLAIIVVPTHCIKSVMAHKAANPFCNNTGAPVYLPHPCQNACSFCTGEYDGITPRLIRGGVCKVLMDLFSGNNRISGDITFMPVLVDAIKKYPGCNKLVFGVNSKTAPAPIIVKKMLLVLLSANIICQSTTVKDTLDGKELGPDAQVVTKAILGYSNREGTTGLPNYAMFDDYYWHRIKLAFPVI